MKVEIQSDVSSGTEVRRGDVHHQEHMARLQPVHSRSRKRTRIPARTVVIATEAEYRRPD